MAMVLHCHAFTQNENWAFGDSAGLSFSTLPPTFLLTNIWTFEPCASISDSLGNNLLFYTNGQKVWNKYNEVMPNGSDLLINVFGGYASSVTQGVIIAPKPASDKEFYLIYMAEGGLMYSVVNIELDGGLGDVTDENIWLNTTDPVLQKMQAVKHANGRDWWVILLRWPPKAATKILGTLSFF
jgi:hypothetical protein